MTKLEAGDTVYVYSRVNSMWCEGRVIRIGRKYATIEYGNRADKFHLDTQYVKSESTFAYFKTFEQHTELQRRLAALDVLRKVELIVLGVDVCKALTVEQLELMAAIAQQAIDDKRLAE